LLESKKDKRAGWMLDGKEQQKSLIGAVALKKLTA